MQKGQIGMVDSNDNIPGVVNFEEDLELHGMVNETLRNTAGMTQREIGFLKQMQGIQKRRFTVAEAREIKLLWRPEKKKP